jgi:hypothetical protein
MSIAIVAHFMGYLSLSIGSKGRQWMSMKDRSLALAALRAREKTL